MEHIQPIIYVNSNSIRGYGILDFERIQNSDVIENQLTAPYMVSFIESSEDGESIMSARVIFNDGNQRFSTTMNTELQNVSLFLNSETLKEGSLVDKISQYLTFYNENDLSALFLPFLSDTASNSTISVPTGSSVQKGVDSFVVGLVMYLAALKFLLEDNIYRDLPFHFTLPYYNVNENCMNCNMFKYMCYPATAIATHGVISGSRILFEQILTFCNEWGPVFDEGPAMDYEPAILDTVSGYCKLTVSDLSEFQRQMLYLQDHLSNSELEIRDTVDVVIKETKEEINSTVSNFKDVLAEEFARKEEEINVTVSNFKDVLAEEFARKEKEMKSRIDMIFAEKLDEFQVTIQDVSMKELQRHTKKSKKRKKHSSRDYKKYPYSSKNDRFY